jgi:outer membrane protein assembly factor BamE (lipoprotein component of BamABCDE complex)
MGRGSPESRRLRNGAIRVFCVAALGLGLCGCVGYDGDFDRGYIVDPRVMAQIKVGETTKPQALTLMGTPSTTSTVGGDAWYYIGQKMQRSLAFMAPKMTDQFVVALYFDKSGKVERVANYGMKDGKVFDFVSRTTPTAGAEPSFLGNMFKNLMRFS